MRRVFLSSATIACLCVCVLAPHSTQAQSIERPGQVSSIRSTTNHAGEIRPVTDSHTRDAYVPYATPADQKLAREIADATQQLRDTNDTKQRAAARQRLAELLSTDYDERLRAHGDDLDRLEEQLAQMRKRLEKRRAAKQDMIELRLRVLETEASDLGWPARRDWNAATATRWGWETNTQMRDYSPSTRRPVLPGPPQATEAR